MFPNTMEGVQNIRGEQIVFFEIEMISMSVDDEGIVKTIIFFHPINFYIYSSLAWKSVTETELVAGYIWKLYGFNMLQIQPTKIADIYSRN